VNADISIRAQKNVFFIVILSLVKAFLGPSLDGLEHLTQGGARLDILQEAGHSAR
jgi:hypothetical protein